ncbi:uncharacterized protein BO72DRAFT_84363 [Aspergillus fijiensis CBS 313.89]|uniref:Uncharacterized protein n=1 Tax=Aspergillus fijiensis CBS 313.89 TaxID=1448319 RepID=A0A8G1RTN5_9EURO|nr:uncharacterized protein BO72DRAFT_84363 [Aspergillus fijiensis CBS 313.89]RAK78098.1 hypothetical protein BO72DRAFT_84363 [Aspergillus fijiensis CBS 313.89]
MLCMYTNYLLVLPMSTTSFLLCLAGYPMAIISDPAAGEKTSMSDASLPFPARLGQSES